MAEDLDDHRRIFDVYPERVEGQAMLFKLPPQFEQCSMSMSKEHLSYCTSCSGFVLGAGCHVRARCGELVGKSV
jgi:hypothetical protein